MNTQKKPMTYQLESKQLINRFSELQTDGQKIDYDTAVECAKITAKFIFENGSMLPEDRLYWRCVFKQCDLLHSKEYSLATLEREETKYSTSKAE